MAGWGRSPSSTLPRPSSLKATERDRRVLVIRDSPGKTVSSDANVPQSGGPGGWGAAATGHTYTGRDQASSLRGVMKGNHMSCGRRGVAQHCCGLGGLRAWHTERRV